MAEIALDRVSKRFADGTLAVQQTSFRIADGELFILVGPSGCGKSTLLNMIAGIESVSEGEIRIDGKVVNDVDPKDRNIAMVFQTYALYPHMTVRQNLAFPLRLAGLPKHEIAARVKRAAEILELSELLERKPARLSGGQRQRVAMGRAIVRKPAAFLLDEPLSNLDARLRVQMRIELARLQRDLGTTTVYVTHDQTEAMTLGDRIAVMRKGEVLQIGTPRDLYVAPRDLFVAGFIGSPPMNFLPADIRDGRLVLPMLNMPLPGHLQSLTDTRGRSLVAGVRPEHFQDAALVRDGKQDGEVFEARIDVLEWLGADLYLHFDVPCASARLRGLPDELNPRRTGAQRLTVTARVDPSSRAAEGKHLGMRIDPRHLQLFDAESGARLGRNPDDHDG